MAFSIANTRDQAKFLLQLATDPASIDHKHQKSDGDCHKIDSVRANRDRIDRAQLQDRYEIDMPKSLSERIADRAKTRKPSAIGKNRASFLAVRDDVKQALDDGWPVKTIWETLREEGKVSFGYDAFIGYVNRLIRRSAVRQGAALQTEPAPPAKAGGAGEDSKGGATARPRPAAPNPARGFTFDSTPKKEDLL